MRVLRISHSAVVTAWRGREAALRARGIEVRTLSARTWEEGGRPVHLDPGPGEDVVAVRTLGRHPNIFLYDPRPVWRALGEDWDVLDLHEEPAALATAEVLLLRALRRLQGRTPAPYLLYSAQNIAKRYPPPFRWWERAALRGAGAVSVCNSEAVDVLRAKGLTAPAHVIGLGVDAADGTDGTDAGPLDPGVAGAAAPARTDHAGLTPGRDATPGTDTDRHPGAGADAGAADARADAGVVVRVGFAGRLLAPHKGLDVLLDAAELDPHLHVALAGAGPHEDALRRRAATPALAGRVTFHGHLSGDALAAFYRRLDVLAVPSVAAPGWLEQFGRVAVEAMAAGVPVVASDSGALRDVVGGAGILVPPGDAPALATALREAGSDPVRSAELVAAGRTRAARYTWRAIAARYEHLYRTLTPTPTPPAPLPTLGATGVPTVASGARTLGTPGTPSASPDGTTGGARAGSGAGAGAGSGAGAGVGSGVGVEVIVVAYGVADLLGRALGPVAGELPVTVVDNSGDPEVRRVCAAAGVRYLDPGANLGFGAAINHALARRAQPDADVLLLNPDARVDLDGVRALHRALHAHADLAAVGPAQVDEDGHPARVRWPFPTPAGAWRQAAGLGVPDTPDGFVIGSVLLLRAEALAAVGGFDEAYFLYSEETDWQRRAHAGGWRSAVAEDVHARHVGAGTSTDPTRRETHFHASQERYFRTHHGAAGWTSVRTAVLLGSVPRAALPGDRGRSARLRLRLYLRGPLRAEAALGDPRAPRTARVPTTTPAPPTGTPRAPAPGTTALGTTGTTGAVADGTTTGAVAGPADEREPAA